MSLTQLSKMNSTADENNWTVVNKRSKKERTSTDEKKKLLTIMAARPSIIREEMTIEADLVGFVVGRKANRLKRLKEVYGVNVILPPRGGSHIIIEGRAEMVSAAKKEIEERLSCQTRFIIEKDYIPIIIGREGECVLAMQDKLDVNIAISKVGEVLITGTRCGEARKAIEETLLCKTSFSVENVIMVIGREGKNIQALEREFGVSIAINIEKEEVVITGTKCKEAKEAFEENLSVKTRFFVEKECVPMVIGREGKNLRALEDSLNVRIHINKEDGEIVVRGTRYEEAKKTIEEKLSYRTRFFIEKDYTHLVRGLHGENLVGLEEKFKVDININKIDGEVVVFGKEGKAAKKAIESLIERLKTTYLYQEKFSIPTCLIRFVCGKSGSYRKMIESTHNVHVFISAPSAKDDSQIVIVKGSLAGNVFAAKRDILENLPSAWSILDVEESSVRGVIGREGETVQRLENEHDVSICFEDGKAYIFGEKKDHTEAAKDAIISIMLKFKKKDDDDTSP